MKWFLLAIIIVSSSAADLLKSVGMRKHGEVRDFRPTALGRAILAVGRNRFVIAAILADLIAFFAFVALLSVADLSFAVPATAGIFVLETLCARILLKENVNWQRWVGVSFIVCGISILSR